ncbi:MAG: exo-alpha-sialidase [Anaerolineales bacterium]|nr:exo-alpha-sialidase [Anaerolineales bacterium]
MKKIRSLFNVFITLVMFTSIFWTSVPKSYAQESEGWSTPFNLSESGSATNPVMVVDFRGTIHSIWMEGADEYKYSQSTDGEIWSSPVTVAFPFGHKDPTPILLSDANGSIHIFWTSSTDLFYGQATPLEIADPKKWAVNTLLSHDVLAFDVTIDSRNSLNLAYVRKTSTSRNPAGVYYRRSIAGGGSWLEARILYKSEYFRSITTSDAYVRVTTAHMKPNSNNERIYVTWDNRPQKRVYMAVSDDSGLTWGDVQPMKSPEDTGGSDTPFNLTAAAFGSNLLLVWQVGEPGSSKCTVYSQWSVDGGKSWGDTLAVLGGRSECPVSTKIIEHTEKYMSIMLTGQVTPILIAWNGEKWSSTQTQIQFPSFSNPLTYDVVFLGCRFDLIYQQRLYSAGCDQAKGHDVWFLSLPLEPIESWFAPSVVWGEPIVLPIKSETPQRISDFYSTSDTAGNIHVAWVQSPIELNGGENIEIGYARWNGREWTTTPASVVALNGKPISLLLAVDSLKRLFLSWVDSYSGDLLFSWANLEKANLYSEWREATSLPSPSQLVNSSDVLVDASGRIVCVYVIPVNENRGVYVVQSTDNGESWSTPIRVFDAVAASWEEVERPRISLDSDGNLHLVFTRDTVRDGQTVGLYYSRSVDGGVTWSDIQVLSEGEVQWADIVSYGERNVHIVWQEYDGLIFANVSQVSKDGGITWGKQNNVTSVNETATQVSLASDGKGLLHFVQLVNKNNVAAYNQKGLVLQDWKWDETGWSLDLTKDILIKGENINYSLSSSITSTGYLGVFLPIEYTDPVEGTKSEVLAFSRYLTNEGVTTLDLQPPSIPTPINMPNENQASNIQPTPTSDLLVLYEDNVPTSPLQRNLAGIVLIVIGIAATVFLLVRRQSAK